jgi:anti-sigma factor RsiW
MNHDDFRIRLDDYLDGSLPDSERRPMEQHAADCSTCAALLAATTALVEAARSLPRSIEPEGDSWLRLSGALVARRAATPRHGMRAVLALIAASVVLALGVVFTRSRLQKTDASAPAGFAAESFTGLVTGLELECNGVGRSLQASLSLPEANSTPTVGAWTPGVAAAVEILDRSIAETRSALEQAPGNPTLQIQLAMRYQQKLALLQLALACADKA